MQSFNKCSINIILKKKKKNFNGNINGFEINLEALNTRSNGKLVYLLLENYKSLKWILIHYKKFGFQRY